MHDTTVPATAGRPRARAGQAWIVCLAATVAGCGAPSGPQRFALSGRVTRDGQPVVQGRIALEPVEPVVADGKPLGDGFAPIRNGLFSTADLGRGHFGGPHRITVTGLATAPLDPTSSEPVYPPLFEPYDMTADLPRRTSTLDIVVPPTTPRRNSHAP